MSLLGQNVEASRGYRYLPASLAVFSKSVTVCAVATKAAVLRQVAAGRSAADDHADPLGAPLRHQLPAASALSVRARVSEGGGRIAGAATDASAPASRPERFSTGILHPMGLSSQPSET